MNLIRRGWYVEKPRRLNPGDIVISAKGSIRYIVGRAGGLYLYVYDLADADDDNRIYSTQRGDELFNWIEVNDPTPEDLDWLKRRETELLKLLTECEKTGEKFVVPDEWKLPELDGGQ